MPFAAQDFSQRRGFLTLGAGVLLPPVAWFLDQQISYALVPWTCATGRQFALHVVTLAMLLLAATGGLIAWRNWQHTKGVQPEGPGRVLSRRRFMAVGGLLSSSMFLLVIVAQAIPSFMLSACEP